MASKRQRKNGTWEFKFTRKGLLHTPVYFTFDTEEEGDRYAETAELLLERGVVPPEMGGTKMTTLGHLMDAYEVSGMATKSDHEMFKVVGADIGKTDLKLVNYDWVERWVNRMVADGLAPSTMKKRTEFVARALDWAMRKNMVSLQNNPVKLLPKGYASRNVAKEKLWAGQRDRRLELRVVAVGGKEYQTEEGAIRSVLKNEEHLLVDMALETAMRMSEMVTLKRHQIDFKQKTIFLNKTKNGSKRQVPISSVLDRLLREYLPTIPEDREELFPYWSDPNSEDPKVYEKSVKATTNRLSTKFGYRFKAAGCADLRFHDLRHEATSRLFERTTMTDTEIASVTGHKDPRMLLRYANLRGSNLAAKMW